METFSLILLLTGLAFAIGGWFYHSILAAGWVVFTLIAIVGAFTADKGRY